MHKQTLIRATRNLAPAAPRRGLWASHARPAPARHRIIWVAHSSVQICPMPQPFWASMSCNIARVAAPRWDRAFFSSGASSALVLPTSGNHKSGS